MSFTFASVPRHVTKIMFLYVQNQVVAWLQEPSLFIVNETRKIMTNKALLMIMLMVLAFSIVNGQDLPPKHRGMHPILKADGTVVDETGKPLGSIKNGKVCDVSGKVIGVIAAHGDVTTASGKSIGKIQKDGSFKSMKGHVVT